MIEVKGPRPFQFKFLLLSTTEITSMAEKFHGVVDKANVKVIPACVLHHLGIKTLSSK